MVPQGTYIIQSAVFPRWEMVFEVGVVCEEGFDFSVVDG